MSKIPIPQANESPAETKEELERIPEGFHTASLIDIEHQTTPNTHKAYVRAEFEIDNEGAFEGRHVSTNIFLTPDARWRLDSFLAALGHEVPAAFLDEDKLVGKRCKIRVKYSEDGRYPEITKFRAIREKGGQ